MSRNAPGASWGGFCRKRLCHGRGHFAGAGRAVAHSFIDLKQFAPKPDLIKLLPEAPARRFRALVLGQLPDGRLQIGLSDPTDLQAYDEITRLVKREIDLKVIPSNPNVIMVRNTLAVYGGLNVENKISWRFSCAG